MTGTRRRASAEQRLPRSRCLVRTEHGAREASALLHEGYQNYREYGTVRVGGTGEYQRQLTPTVTRIEWRPTGAKTASISVKGNNFFTDPQVCWETRSTQKLAAIWLSSRIKARTRIDPGSGSKRNSVIGGGMAFPLRS